MSAVSTAQYLEAFLVARYPGQEVRWHGLIDDSIRFVVGSRHLDISKMSLEYGSKESLCLLAAKGFDSAMAEPGPKPQRTPFRPGRKRVRFVASVPHATMQRFNDAGVWVPVRRPGAWSGT